MPDTSKPHPAIKDFTPEQWDEMIYKLMGFTYRYFETLFEGNIKEAQTFDGDTYEDIAQEIICRVLEGVRRWNPDKDGDLLPYMAGQVKSLVSHGFDSWNARNVESMNEFGDEEDDDTFMVKNTHHETPSTEDNQKNPSCFKNIKNLSEFEEQEVEDKDQSSFIPPLINPNPELVLISQEFQIERDKLLDIILEAVDKTDDADLWSLVEAYLDDSGEYKPREIASRLGIPTTEFNNRRKKLIRCVKKYLSEQSSGTRG